jgi:hypothetical protein
VAAERSTSGYHPDVTPDPPAATDLAAFLAELRRLGDGSLLERRVVLEDGVEISDLQSHVQVLLDEADEYRAMTPEERASEPIAEMRRAVAAEFRRLRAALAGAECPDGRATG